MEDLPPTEDEITGGPEPYVEMYEDAAGGWRWRKIGANHSDVVSDSGQSYTRSNDVLSAARREHPNLDLRLLDSDGYVVATYTP